MKTNYTGLLKKLLIEINRELVVSKTRPGVLEQGTNEYVLLASRLEQWKKVLGRVNRGIYANKSKLSLRSQKVHSLASDLRYSEEQAINSISQNIHQLELQIKEIGEALAELVFNVTVPTDFEAFTNALKQIKGSSLLHMGNSLKYSPNYR